MKVSSLSNCESRRCWSGFALLPCSALSAGQCYLRAALIPLWFKQWQTRSRSREFSLRSYRGRCCSFLCSSKEWNRSPAVRDPAVCSLLERQKDAEIKTHEIIPPTHTAIDFEDLDVPREAQDRSRISPFLYPFRKWSPVRVGKSDCRIINSSRRFFFGEVGKQAGL